jgi:hypothetical protein
MNFRSLFAVLVLAVLVAGCQSTSIRSAWFDTNFSGPPMRKVVVVGSINSVSDGRVFEDLFAQRLRAAGIEGVAGYTVIADEARVTDASFASAVANTGAQGLLLVRLLGVDTRTQVSTTMVSGGMGWGSGPWGGSSWGGSTWGGPRGGMVPVQQVSQYELATVEAKLFDVQTRQLVWAATTTTFNPTSVARETPGFADLIIGQLAGRGVIAGK